MKSTAYEPSLKMQITQQDHPDELVLRKQEKMQTMWKIPTQFEKQTQDVSSIAMALVFLIKYWMKRRK